MDAKALHESAIVVDGLEICKWERPVFEDMRRGGLTLINATCSVWEGFNATMDNIAQWKRLFRDNSDLILQVNTADDIHRAKRENKTGIILGWQNTYGIEDRVEYLQIFKDLGVGCMQLTYNTQNLVGAGCWESKDNGLSDFGRDVIDEMNAIGILVDLSHVGAQTSEDAILHSSKPVAYTHVAPASIKPHPRNKTDEQLKFIVEHGGFVGFAPYSPFLPKGSDTTVSECVEILEYLVNLLGEDSVGIGTDYTQGHGLEFFEYLSHDKGDGRRLIERKPGGGVTIMPHGIRTVGDFGNFTQAMVERNWPETRIRKVIGENWVRVYTETWNV